MIALQARNLYGTRHSAMAITAVSLAFKPVEMTSYLGGAGQPLPLGLGRNSVSRSRQLVVISSRLWNLCGPGRSHTHDHVEQRDSPRGHAHEGLSVERQQGP